MTVLSQVDKIKHVTEKKENNHFISVMTLELPITEFWHRQSDLKLNF